MLLRPAACGEHVLQCRHDVWCDHTQAHSGSAKQARLAQGDLTTANQYRELTFGLMEQRQAAHLTGSLRHP